MRTQIRISLTIGRTSNHKTSSHFLRRIRMTTRNNQMCYYLIRIILKRAKMKTRRIMSNSMRIPLIIIEIWPSTRLTLPGRQIRTRLVSFLCQFLLELRLANQARFSTLESKIAEVKTFKPIIIWHKDNLIMRLRRTTCK